MGVTWPRSHRATDVVVVPSFRASASCVRPRAFRSARICFGHVPLLMAAVYTRETRYVSRPPHVTLREWLTRSRAQRTSAPDAEADERLGRPCRRLPSDDLVSR